MRRVFIIVFFLLVFVGGLATYKAYQYLTEVRTHIAQTEVELQKAQIEVAKHMNSLSTQNPQIKRLIERLGGLGKDATMSPEYITILATTLEMIQRMNFGADNNKYPDATPDVTQVLKAIEQLRDLQSKLNQRPGENSHSTSPWEHLINSVHTFAKDSAEKERE